VKFGRGVTLFIGLFDPLRAQKGFDQDLISEFKLAFGYDSEENPRWGSFSFGSVGESSRGTTTWLVGPHWVDFKQTGPGNGEASGLHTLKS
jgi:hypothetical protein